MSKNHNNNRGNQPQNGQHYGGNNPHHHNGGGNNPHHKNNNPHHKNGGGNNTISGEVARDVVRAAITRTEEEKAADKKAAAATEKLSELLQTLPVEQRAAFLERHQAVEERKDSLATALVAGGIAALTLLGGGLIWAMSGPTTK